MPDYDTDEGLLVHLQKQVGNIDVYGAEVGADAVEIQRIKDDCAAAIWTVNFAKLLRTYTATAFSIKKVLLRGDTNAALSDFADAPAAIPPVVLRAGIERRSRERDQRFRRVSNLSDVVRSALDLPGEPTTLRDDIQPAIKLSEGGKPYQFAVQVSGKRGCDMYQVEICRAQTGKWEIAKSGTGKKLSVTVAPTVEGQSERIMVRVQLMRNNRDFGTVSNLQFITINP